MKHCKVLPLCIKNHYRPATKTPRTFASVNKEGRDLKIRYKILELLHVHMYSYIHMCIYIYTHICKYIFTCICIPTIPYKYPPLPKRKKTQTKQKQTKNKRLSVTLSRAASFQFHQKNNNNNNKTKQKMHQNPPPFTQNPPGPLLQSFLQLKDFVFNMATTVAGDLVMHKAGPPGG